MKYNILLTLIPFLLFSCTEDPTPENDQVNLIDESLLKAEWFLHLINDEEIEVTSYDSTKCIDDLPYGFIDGEKIQLVDSPPPVSSKKISDVRFFDEWHFNANDSLTIFKVGESTESWECYDGNLINLTTGTNGSTYYARYSLNQNQLLVERLNDSEEKYTFQIDSLTEEVLELQLLEEDLNLSFLRMKAE